MKNTNSVYDIRGNRIVFQNFDANKTWWFEYDNNNNIIHKKCSDGEEKWYYDGFECSLMEFENNYVQEMIWVKKA